MRNLYFLITLSVILLLVSFHGTQSYFSDSAVSGANTFATASEFPTNGGAAPTSAIPSPTGTQVGVGDVVINEIMWMGTQGDAADEWIELRNMTTNTIDISGWVIDNLGSGVTNDIVIPAGKTIAPYSFFMIANDTKATGNHNIDPDHIANISLLNPGEQLILRVSVDGAIIDIANGTDDWLAGVDPGGQNPERSMERNVIPGDGTIGTNWHSATTAVNMDIDGREIATPKAANSL